MGEHKLLAERMFEEIRHLMTLMAMDITNPGHWQLNFEDALADLFAKMVEVVWEYEDKPFGELKAIVIKSLHNHKVTLLRRCYGTHRVAELRMEDLDDVEDQASEDFRYFALDDFLASLPSEDSRSLVLEILRPSMRTRFFIELTIMRKMVTSDNGGWKVSLTPLLMERALGWTEQRLTVAWKEVTDTYQEYSA